MKIRQHKWWKNAAAVMLIAVSGCYSYTQPAAATFGESYTKRQKDKADDLLKDVQLLTLRDAQRIAIKNNPTYIAAYHSMEAARMKYLQAWGAYSPTISAGFDMGYSVAWQTRSPKRPGHHHPRENSFATQTGVQANMLLFDGFARLFKLKAAKSGFNYQALMEEDACRTMMEAVAYAYNTVLLAIENRRIAIEDRKFQQSSLENTRHKFDAGAAPLSDVLNFEIYVHTADVSLVEANYQYEVAVYALAQLMGYPEGVLPAHVKFPSDYKKDFIELPAVDIYLNAALANRPDLKGYREQLNIAKYQVYQAWGAFSPTVKGYFNWGYRTDHTDGYSTGYRGEQNDKTNMEMGINVDWVIFNGAVRYNQLREAQASQAVSEYQVAAKWFAVVNDVRSAYANYNKSVKKTKLYAQVRALSAKQRDLVDEEYKAGKAELTRLNEAQRDLVSYESKLASSYVAVQNAKAQLDYAVGANTALFYETRKDAKSDRAPGLESLDPAKLKSSTQTAPQKPAQQVSVPGPLLKSGVPAVRKEAAKPAAKPAAKAVKSAPKSDAEKAGIPASPTAQPRKK